MFVFTQLLRYWPASKIQMVLSFDGMLTLTFTIHFLAMYDMNVMNTITGWNDSPPEAI